LGNVAQPADHQGNAQESLWVDSIGAITVLSLLTAVTAFFLMRAFLGHRLVAVTVISASLAAGFIALLLLLFQGDVNVTLVSAEARDYFVVYAMPLSVAAAVGTAVGSAVANR
jgi:hypothetical protein